MALGYRHWSGVTLISDCESALNYYRLVANKGQFFDLINFLYNIFIYFEFLFEIFILSYNSR